MGTKKAKSYARSKPLKGPPAVTPWWAFNVRTGGQPSPVVIRRKLGYVTTRMNNLAKWEKVYAEEEAKPEDERHPKALDNIRVSVKNAERWLQYSAQTLRNAVRFALARIEHDSEDHIELRRLRTDHGMAFVHKTGIGVRNKEFHADLRYYAKVLDEFLLAKTAVSGTSGADAAMQEIWKLCKKAIAVYKGKSGRETDDAEQQAALGIMRACKKFDPGKGGLARFATYSSHWIRRMSQARKASDCRPGLTIKGGEYKFVGTLNVSTEDSDDRADKFHPKAKVADVNLQLDVRKALDALPELERELAERHLLGNEKVKALAEEKNISVGQVRSALLTAKEQLAKLLKSHAPD